jgi:hypothetical protein
MQLLFDKAAEQPIEDWIRGIDYTTRGNINEARKDGTLGEYRQKLYVNHLKDVSQRSPLKWAITDKATDAARFLIGHGVSRTSSSPLK